MRIPWTARISNQSILKKINFQYSSEGLMLKLKFKNFGHLMREVKRPDDRNVCRQEEKGVAEDEMVRQHH